MAPAERGTTVIPERVVARIAARVASTTLRRRIDPGSDLAAPGARATTHGGRAHLTLTVDLPYPTDIADTCRRLQREVAEQVAQLTGLEVRDVTLTIRRLATVGGPVRVQ
ncbi:Asp23/Gls24 family envelope stress response protein [Streptomyces sp. ME02-6991-2B]|nr:Asp23/Gls24 family envelope stress response protein [Streptomyces sp. ME02-6991-2B]